MIERYYVVERRFRCGRVACRDCGALVVDRLTHDLFHTRLSKLERGLPIEDGGPVRALGSPFPAPSPRHLGDLGWQT